MNMVKRNSEIKPFYSNFLDDFLNTGLSAFEDRRGVPALNVKEDEKELALELRVPGMKKEDIHQVKQLWHGSRNENWFSILENGLQLNPNAIITGKMFGKGIYFAPSSNKSWNYTSYRGT